MRIQDRVRNVLTKPADEWPVIAQEPAEVASLMREYAGPLAAVPALCRVIGMSVFGITLPIFGTYRVGIFRGLANAVLTWVMALVGAYIAAVVIEKLAPTFQSKGTTIQALKLVVYSMTPVWVAGVLLLVPALGALTILAALYAIYLFYLGLPVVMGTPSGRVIPYMVVSALVIIVVSFVLALVTSAVAGVGAGMMF